MRVFEETQRFNQWWLWLLHLGALGFLSYSFYQWFLLGEATGNVKVTDTTAQIIVILVILMGTGLIHIFKLDTTIDEKGIRFRFFPIQQKFKIISWNELEKSFVRKYNPLKEYGGWGYRIGLSGRAYNIKGNQGIQIEYKNGKKLLIGTQKPQEAQKTIDKYMNHEGV